MTWLLNGFLAGIGLLFGVWLVLAMLDGLDSKLGQKILTVLVGTVATGIAVLLGLGFVIGLRAVVGH